MSVISISINCGEKTCACEVGRFCQFLRTRKFGSIYYCHLWHEMDVRGKPASLESKDGWLQRRPECLDATGSPS